MYLATARYSDFEFVEQTYKLREAFAATFSIRFAAVALRFLFLPFPMEPESISPTNKVESSAVLLVRSR